MDKYCGRGLAPQICLRRLKPRLGFGKIFLAEAPAENDRSTDAAGQRKSRFPVRQRLFREARNRRGRPAYKCEEEEQPRKKNKGSAPDRHGLVRTSSRILLRMTTRSSLK